MSTFEAWPKTPRWNREVVITEKIDGTNSCIVIEPILIDFDAPGDREAVLDNPMLLAKVLFENVLHGIYAQSRNRMITPGKTTDNYGFAAWVQENAAELVKLLGPGRHFGEWYGKGIARGYGLDHKRFALFNVRRWEDKPFEIGASTVTCYQIHPTLPIDVVPTLYAPDAPRSEDIDFVINALREQGSALALGFDRPEGVILYHTASKQNYKILLENDALPKGVAA